MNISRILKPATLALALAVASTLTVQASPAVRVGDFIVQLAKAKNLNSSDPVVAADSLAAIGVLLPADLNASKSLTEGDVVRISRLAGLNVSTNRPDAVFDRLQLDRFFVSFSGELGATTRGSGNPGNGSGPGNGKAKGKGKGKGQGGPPFDPFSKGQGMKKGKGKRPTTETGPS